MYLYQNRSDLGTYDCRYIALSTVHSNRPERRAINISYRPSFQRQLLGCPNIYPAKRFLHSHPQVSALELGSDLNYHTGSILELTCSSNLKIGCLTDSLAYLIGTKQISLIPDSRRSVGLGKRAAVKYLPSCP